MSFSENTASAPCTGLSFCVLSGRAQSVGWVCARRSLPVGGMY